MIIINEAEDTKLKSKNVVVPPRIRQIASKILRDNYGNENISNDRNSNSRPGYKILKHVVDPNYNKFKKQPNEDDKSNNNIDLDKPVSMPAITAKKLEKELGDPNLTSHKLQNTLKSWAQSSINHERNKVKSNSLVPKVKKTAAPKDETEQLKPSKPSKLGNGTISINSGVIPKTVNLTENQLLSIINLLKKK